MATATDRPRGTCPVCGKHIRVKQDGTLMYHGFSVAIRVKIRNGTDRWADPGYCRGMGQKPVKVVAS